MSSFFRELKQRRVYRVAIGYAVIAWLVIQISATVIPAYHAPDWILPIFITVIALGFPVALVLGWAFELKDGAIELADRSGRVSSANRGRLWLLGAGGLLLSLIAVGTFWLWHGSRAQRRPTTEADSASAPSKLFPQDVSVIPQKSIAVLPFQNLSEDKANAFFASGIQDEIITALAKISGLRVISRTSTARYQSSPENLPQIAGELRVANILEGSVQKAGDKVHINVQLVRADSDAHLWAQSYDRGLGDIFGVEAEVARSVADELRAALTPEEKVRVETKPTENNEAYLLYLRALAYDRPTDLLQDMQKAVDFYAEAIKVDPGFALARARLSETLAHIYLNYQPTDAVAARARAEAGEALRLQPDLGEAHHARALCLYWTQKDYAAALRELEIAARLLPNDADIEADTAYIYRRQGRWRDALAMLQHSLSRDPRATSTAAEHFRTFCYVRDWSAAARARERVLPLAGDSPTLGVALSYLDVWSNGDLNALATILAPVPAGVDPDGLMTLARFDAAMLRRDFDAAERAVTDCATETVLYFGGIPTPKSYLLGCIALARGDGEKAKESFEAARAAFEAETKALPRDPFRHAQLGLVYAYLQRNDDATREGLRAVELVPDAADAMDGPVVHAALALIYARTGRVDEALPLIERLLTTPSELNPGYDCNITLPELRLRWQWDPLRTNPRFQKILAGPEPKTVYK